MVATNVKPVLPATRSPSAHRARLAQRPSRLLILGALGVVFGDIGTSPLYALQTVFTRGVNGVSASTVDVYGVLSLVFWTLIVVVSIEFVVLMMRADNDGEGGIMALIALVQRALATRTRQRIALVTLGLIGVALFFGDGMITPAISVLSAVEGLKVVDPSLGVWVLPIAVVVLTALFLAQRFGTSMIGKLFGPIMVLWFAVIALIGLRQVFKDPAILQAVLPTYALAFLVEHPLISFIALGSIVLTITGTEALYADMGHFGRPAITRAWFWIVFPALLLNYAGQGSLILENPKAVANPFFLLVPTWATLPMVILATIATVIASQAVISGAFSVTNQAIRAGFLPRMRITHTSNTEIGQVYAPVVNWMLFVAVIGLVLGFRSSASLASAYGIAVTGTLLIDTVLFLVVMRELWKRPRWNIALAGIVFLSVNVAFLAANLNKFVSGGWLPVSVAIVVFILMTTWFRGRQRVLRKRNEAEGTMADFVTAIARDADNITVFPGTSVHLSLSGETAPLALQLASRRLHALSARVIVVTVQLESEPVVDDSDRLTLDQLAESPINICALRARFGFREAISIPRILELVRDQKLLPDLDVESVTYIVSQLSVEPDTSAGMARWRKRMFAAMWVNANPATQYFDLPPERTVTFGAQVGV